MEVILGVLIGIVGLLGIVFSRLITTFVHELGHTVAALLLVDGPVEMYVGSYGDEKKSLKIKLGRLTLFLSFIIWNLEIGLCVHHRSKSLVRNMIVVLAGPLLSLALGFCILLLILRPDFSDGQKFILSVFMLSSIWDFFVNLIPRNEQINLDNGHGVFNDGRQLMEMYRIGKLPEAFVELHQHMANDDLEKALNLALRLKEEDPNERRYHEAILDIYYCENKLDDFLASFEVYRDLHNPRLRHLAQWAEIKLKLHAYDEVVQILTKVIFEGKGNYEMHFLRGQALTQLGEYKDAMRDFHALTLGENEDPRALANRAYCQFRLGYVAEACEDVLEAIEFGKKDRGEIYFLAGQIFEGSDQARALSFYKSAEQLKYSHHALAFNISRIEKYE